MSSECTETVVHVKSLLKLKQLCTEIIWWVYTFFFSPQDSYLLNSLSMYGCCMLNATGFGIKLVIWSICMSQHGHQICSWQYRWLGLWQEWIVWFTRLICFSSMNVSCYSIDVYQYALHLFNCINSLVYQDCHYLFINTSFSANKLC